METSRARVVGSEMKKFIRQNLTIYRCLVAAGFVVAVILALAMPVRMIGASPWAYYYGVQNFARGELVIDDKTHNQQVREARQKGGVLIQYLKIGPNQWALEKAPGYTLLQVPFHWLGIPRWANIILALGMVIVTFILMKRWQDEKTACISCLLLLFTPVTLIMMNNAYFDSLAALSFLVMGGGLYIYYHLKPAHLRAKKAGWLLFLVFLFIGWAVVTRYTNITVAAVFVLHYIISRAVYIRKKQAVGLGTEVTAVALGVALPLSALLIYNLVVFGSPFKYGYQYSMFPIKFAFQYLGQFTSEGQSLPLHLLVNNLKSAPLPLLRGFPVLIIGLPAAAVVLYLKLKTNGSAGRWSDLKNVMPWGILIVLAGWFVGVFLLYLTYEFTAQYLGKGESYIRFARFYLPGIFPVVVLAALVTAKLPFRIIIPLLAALIIAGSIIHTHYVQGQDARQTFSPPRVSLENHHYFAWSDFG
ncbi:MAG TPA: hypothetical protein VLH15_02290 [Dehalococcoidales bacterium]|nr:hypothetical protein [Dehalococcoidales bacterium]